MQRRLHKAPEVLKNRIFSEASDAWSFATLAWEVLSKGEIPFGTIDGNDIFEFLSAGNRLKIPEEISNEWENLFNQCWKEQKEEWPKFTEIKIQIGFFLERQTLDCGYLITNFKDNKKL
uniref:Protein kinase domain-containing protein n=1 Tax=Panagrolaimus sp. PS1159 TaxID=55785 RepID=A0AC35F4T9_9BILA